jgi:two-component SAPR family response regulator
MALDIKMPGMNGFDLFKEIQKVNDKIKVSFITAYDLETEENKALISNKENLLLLFENQFP